MAYERNERDTGRGYGGYGRDYDRGGYARDDERGFLERAGDEVRSWFGDEEAERRRRADEAMDERYDRERYARGDQGGYRRPDSYPAWARSNRDEGYAQRRPGAPRYSGVRYDRTDEGRQFDDGGAARDAYGYGESDYGTRAGSDRDVAGRYRDRARYEGSRGYPASGWERDAARTRRDTEHGDYHDWRDRQLSVFDRDYAEYRHENRQRFESEFAAWRASRQTQRDSLASIQEHQEVVGSDGSHVGTVDHVRADHILLTKTDRDAGGHHHAIPSRWIATVADKVTLTKTADEAKRAWRDTEERGGLFGGDRDQTDTNASGERNLGRSFNGTY